MKTIDSHSTNECYIIGGGPSLKGFDWSKLDGKFVIAVNRSYEVLPNAQIVYFTDDDWYELHQDALQNHNAHKIKGSLNKSTDFEGVTQYLLTEQHGLVMEDGCLAHGHNSTHAAINLAVQMNFNKIYLMGIDMKWCDGVTHWHNGHTRICPEGAYNMMLYAFDKIVEPLNELGVEVINVNTPEQTALTAFPIQSLEETFG